MPRSVENYANISTKCLPPKQRDERRNKRLAMYCDIRRRSQGFSNNFREHFRLHFRENRVNIFAKIDRHLNALAS